MSLKPNIFEQRSNKTIALLREEIAERDQTIKELRESNDGIKQTNLEAYAKVEELLKKNEELMEALKEAVLYIASDPSKRLIKTEEKIIKNGIKLINK
jgi:hypothetical protein